MNLILTYDISNGNTRARVAAMVSAWGDRIERSVYRCSLEPEALEDLLDRIDLVIDHGSDSVHVFTQCATCAPAARFVGQAVAPTPDPYWIL